MRTQKCGWTAEETDTLFQEAHLADAEGRSIKSVFDRVAKLTGRKPNSIRNYYYLKLKESEGHGKISFIPFEESEVETLLRTILSEQAQGKSVRSIALTMGHGDKKLMLRYQNKYRSMLKNDPAFVEKIMSQLDAEGIAHVDPFQNQLNRKRRPSKDVAATVSRLVSDLASLGADGEAALSSLSQIVGRAAAVGSHLSISELNNQMASLREANSMLASQLSVQEKLNLNFRERIQSIADISQRFLSLSGMERIAILPEYAADIERWIASL